jgi:hypothetical protein
MEPLVAEVAVAVAVLLILLLFRHNLDQLLPLIVLEAMVVH